MLAESDCHWADDAPHCDTWRLVGTKREASKKNWDFAMKSVVITRQHFR